MLWYVGPVAGDCISNKIKSLPLHMYSSQAKSQLLAGYELLCDVSVKSFWIVLNWAHFLFLSCVLCLTCTIANLAIIKYRLDLTKWLLLPSFNQPVLFVLSTAIWKALFLAYLQHKHGLVLHAVFTCISTFLLLLTTNLSVLFAGFTEFS